MQKMKDGGKKVRKLCLSMHSVVQKEEDSQ